MTVATAVHTQEIVEMTDVEGTTAEADPMIATADITITRDMIEEMKRDV